MDHTKASKNKGLESLKLPPEEEIRAIYQEGEEAVVAVMTGLMATIRALEARIQVLEDQIAKNSGNSSKSPSSDGLKRKTKRSLRRPSGKKNGGQKGHKGHRLESVADPDEIADKPQAEGQGAQGTH